MGPYGTNATYGTYFQKSAMLKIALKLPHTRQVSQRRAQAATQVA
jgi:hypothetical protein